MITAGFPCAPFAGELRRWSPARPRSRGDTFAGARQTSVPKRCSSSRPRRRPPPTKARTGPGPRPGAPRRRHSLPAGPRGAPAGLRGGRGERREEQAAGSLHGLTSRTGTYSTEAAPSWTPAPSPRTPWAMGAHEMGVRPDPEAPLPRVGGLWACGATLASGVLAGLVEQWLGAHGRATRGGGHRGRRRPAAGPLPAPRRRRRPIPRLPARLRSEPDRQREWERGRAVRPWRLPTSRASHLPGRQPDPRGHGLQERDPRQRRAHPAHAARTRGTRSGWAR